MRIFSVQNMTKLALFLVPVFLVGLGFGYGLRLVSAQTMQNSDTFSLALPSYSVSPGASLGGGGSSCGG